MGESKVTLAPADLFDGLPKNERQRTDASSHRVGLLINGFASSYYGLMAESAVECLKRHGIETLAPNVFEVKARSAGFLAGLKAAGLTLIPEHCVEDDFMEDGGAKAMQMLMQSKKAFSAVFFHNDEMAVGALTACADKGLRVPEDFSFIGLDDVPLSSMTNPALTTIRQPLRKIGEESARLMFQLLKMDSVQSQEAPSNTKFDPVANE